ncbi:MAG: hypothetical protein JW709_04370 [Sedimentisphaerales bacterium]|nr:hypothetical protein [Sedimentisphaerales bacterium]
MDEQKLLDEMIDLARRLGLEVRITPLGGEGGGVCRVRDKRVLFIDALAAIPERLERTAQGLAGLPDLDDCFILPEVRQYLEQYTGDGKVDGR